MKIYCVTYRGDFGFIKPWSAVRDELTFSQQFLTPSIVMGIERKLFPELLMEENKIHKILRHKLTYAAIDRQQEQTQARGWNKKKNSYHRPYAILTRGVMIRPALILAFASYEDASNANNQHICLCRNEDILFPNEKITEIEDTDFDKTFSGFELQFQNVQSPVMVGYNRYRDFEPMYGDIHIQGECISDYLNLEI
ncbi:MAG: hypothetical protein ACRCZQ_04885 [Bacteroidales bacterium]